MPNCCTTIFRALLAGLLAAHCACASPQDPQATPSDPQLAKLVNESRTIVLGEIHGCSEVPRFAIDVVDAALATKQLVVLGVEVWASEQQRVSVFVKSGGTAADKKALLHGPFWRATRDGRSSAAMLQLLDSARQRIAKKQPLRVLCFDQHVGERKITRDRAMADCLLAMRKLDEDAKHVILTGNAHARTKIGTRWDPKFVPMAHVMRATDKTLRAINLRHSGGEFWASFGKDECGPRKLGGRGKPDARGVTLFAERNDRGDAGVFDLGPVTASPPACDEPLNTTCPRSGKAVVKSSMSRYRGHVVGFCNTHCRDDFAGNVAERPDDKSFFDARIKALRELRFAKN